MTKSWSVTIKSISTMSLEIIMWGQVLFRKEGFVDISLMSLTCPPWRAAHDWTAGWTPALTAPSVSQTAPQAAPFPLWWLAIAAGTLRWPAAIGLVCIALLMTSVAAGGNLLLKHDIANNKPCLQCYIKVNLKCVYSKRHWLQITDLCPSPFLKWILY